MFFFSSAFPPTCQKKHRRSPWRLCKLQEIKRKLWQQVKILLVTCSFLIFPHLLTWPAFLYISKPYVSQRYNQFVLRCSGSLLWTRWSLVSGNISTSCWGRNFSTNLRGRNTRTSWPTTQIHLCLRSTVHRTYSDSLVKTPTQHYSAIMRLNLKRLM